MFDRVADKMERYMDLLSTRQKLVASNIANVDTPGYKTRDVDFHFEFVSKLQAASQADQARVQNVRWGSGGGGASAVGAGNSEKTQANVIEPDLPSKNDGNNVSLDREARLLAENSVRFQMASLLARGEMRRIRTAIQEGRNG